MKTAGRDGFTLMEVLVAIAILAIVTVVLLGRRVEIIRDTGRARDQRLAYALLAQKMAEIEMDQESFLSEASAGRGDFRDTGTEYANFECHWTISKQDVPTNDPAVKSEQPKKIFHVKLAVKKVDEEEDLVAMEAMFSVPAKKATTTTDTTTTTEEPK